jgi:FKBP-type peptidyl-prolyl cis-trans isomerase
MRKLNTGLNLCATILLAIVLVSGCKKEVVTYTAENEIVKIKDWLEAMTSNKYNIDTTSTGLFYIVETAGTGRTVQTGDTVTVQYIGMFLDGTIFDSSASVTYIHKATGQRRIQGWEEGIEVLNKGEVATFLIPSAKAYGSYGYSFIPPFTPLLFTIGIVNIK